MVLVSYRCPNCEEDIVLDSGRDVGFCIYCGSKIMIDDTLKNTKIGQEVRDLNPGLTGKEWEAMQKQWENESPKPASEE